MKQGQFLYKWKQTNGKFIRPKFKWFFGRWINESNLPVWRTGNTVWIVNKKKKDEYKNEFSMAKLESSEWTELGRKNHPILSRIFKHPTYELPLWLSFYLFNDDIGWKTKWTEQDFRYEDPAHITLVFFGLAISVTAYIPKENKDDWTCQDDYWESLMTYNYFKGDLKKTNEEMGWWTTPVRFRFNPRFLTDSLDRDDLEALQEEQLPKILKKYEDERRKREERSDSDS